MNKYTSRDERKSARQAAILEAVAQGGMATQNDLVAALRRRGIEATQAAVSRDAAELGLAKVGGAYQPAAGASAADPEMPLRAFVRNVVAAGPHLTVVRCDPGAAQRVAFALDELPLPGLAGTVAGDDTVFVASETGAAQKKLIEFLRSRMPQS